MKPKAIRVLGRFGYFKIWFCSVKDNENSLIKPPAGKIQSSDFLFYLRYCNNTFIDVTDIFTEDVQVALGLALERCFSRPLHSPECIVKDPIMNIDWHLKPSQNTIHFLGRYDFFDIYASAKITHVKSLRQNRVEEFMSFFKKPNGEYIFTLNTLDPKDQQDFMLDAIEIMPVISI